ncbi:hypothetical protein [Burkholderia vietnamiensis]|uniref:hypothetical protein n=1 Tax=Burkholderia vietnamiensis TaxID=60552 RepID=UPI001592F7D9|nr:hypothetical protein [Burkholderia vietnamiensis]
MSKDEETGSGASVMRLSSDPKHLRINVRQVSPNPDPQDRDVEGIYAVIFGVDDRQFSDAKRASMALDIFHAHQGIECLDDFEIEVIDEDGRVIEQDPGHVDYSSSDCGEAEKISGRPVPAEDPQAKAHLESTRREPSEPAFEIVSVSFDVGPSYQAYSRGETWNGWECPYFTFDEAMKVTQHQDMKCLRYDPESDQFVMNDPSYKDDPTYEPEVFKRQNITVDGAQIGVYPIGAFSWCWNGDELERPEPKATTAQWSDWFDNPFKAIKAASEARGTPNDYDRALDVLRRSAEWENFDFDHYLDDVLQEIGGETNIVCQYDGDKASGRRFRAAYDEGPEVVASTDRSVSPDM